MPGSEGILKFIIFSARNTRDQGILGLFVQVLTPYTIDRFIDEGYLHNEMVIGSRWGVSDVYAGPVAWSDV